MFKHYIFYNPLAGGEEAVARIEEFASRYEGALLYDITKGGGYRGICEGLDPSDKVTVSGGDGTYLLHPKEYHQTYFLLK